MSIFFAVLLALGGMSSAGNEAKGRLGPLGLEGTAKRMGLAEHVFVTSKHLVSGSATYFIGGHAPPEFLRGAAVDHASKFNEGRNNGDINGLGGGRKFRAEVSKSPSDDNDDIISWGVAEVPQNEFDAIFRFCRSVLISFTLSDCYAIDVQISPKLAFRRIARDPVRVKGQTDGGQDTKEAEASEPSGKSCPPSGLFGGVGCLPLSAQLVIALVFGGAAGLAFWRALRPFGLLMISRGDIRTSIAYTGVSLGLLAISGWIWMLGA
ncbi:hypothetical protein G4G27_03760 [Sphingomonas sp. So64.6b]|uniref:hypothetical protein n=1 Tax=Sphingomonas sp. So64.6b TaxID=2997354 RepID=UPI001600C98F|nr:hypothetical protein [Sphingomonas sp. So64.6b]QNA83219.1 hypothetical protein G4G27_03760 [Sphingomonas sp. So64.6b]